MEAKLQLTSFPNSSDCPVHCKLSPLPTSRRLKASTISWLAQYSCYTLFTIPKSWMMGPMPRRSSWSLQVWSSHLSGIVFFDDQDAKVKSVSKGSLLPWVCCRILQLSRKNVDDHPEKQKQIDNLAFKNVHQTQPRRKTWHFNWHPEKQSFVQCDKRLLLPCHFHETNEKTVKQLAMTFHCW